MESFLLGVIFCFLLDVTMVSKSRPETILRKGVEGKKKTFDAMALNTKWCKVFTTNRSAYAFVDDVEHVLAIPIFSKPPLPKSQRM